MMLALLLATIVETQAETVALRPLHTIEVASEVATYARDGQFEYLATGGGLYRSASIATASLQRLAAAPALVNGVAVHDGTLYVLKGHTDGVSPVPGLLRSRDGGATFQANDNELMDCSLQPWTNRCDYLVPKRITFGDGRMFLEAGGNLLVAPEGTTSWNVLIGETVDGKPATQMCPLTHERIGARIIAGSECPLDIAWIGSGTLRDDLLDWSVPFSSSAAITPAIGNRMVQFVRHIGNEVVFSGVEGALLKSGDGGRSFRYVLFHPLDSDESPFGYVEPPVVRRYPYVQQFVVSSRHPRRIVVGGFDKVHATAYLAYSNDGGESWRDLSPLVPDALVSLLAEDRDGRIIVGVTDGLETPATRLSLFELQLPPPPSAKRRRAVR